MNRIGKLTVLMLGLWAGAAVAGTASSNEFKLDCRTGLKAAVMPEHIQYSTAWATNLTAAQQGEAKAVVKVNPCLKTPPKYLVVDMSGGRNAERWPISYLDEVPEGGWTDEYKTEKLVLRYSPAGSFIMGGRATDYPGAVNTNLHMVTLTKPFYIGVFECTQRQWELAMGNRPSAFSNETCYATRPADGVSYLNVRGEKLGAKWPFSCEVDEGSFLGIVRRKTGLSGFDLPTEAQWEYACRAGSTTALNTGDDLSVAEFPCAEIENVARYAGNSNYRNMTVAEMEASSDEYCSAKVGSYVPNLLGIYDMHGNLWEWCLDRAVESPLGSVDPVGGTDPSVVRRMIRGGAQHEPAWRCCAGFRYYWEGLGHPQDRIGGTVGFRLCLHGGEVPDLAMGQILVEADGASTVQWTPTRAGMYQLTHEVQVDGVTAGALETALFEVEGPELCISALGELESGVQIEIKSKSEVEVEQWNVYYTLDGSGPTAEATLYEGPFALEESATVRAVAISEAGVRCDEARADFTLHDAMSVVGAVARQRYPWNGMVDIDCEITGDSNRVYAVEVVATDLDGGTNLPVKTVHMATRPESAPYRLAPGKYRFTWNADADITGDFDFANVSVSVSAKGGPLVGYARQMTISTDGYAGSETLTNVPVLVRLSTAIAGFDYNDFASPSNGADMVFMDEAETQVLPYEIDEWHTNGESLVWVKIPELKRGTKFMLAYGGMGTGNRELGMGNGEERQHEVWREYAGVWHMNEDSGTAFDSTEHGLDALPDCGVNGDISQMVAYENGACGRARVNSRESLARGNCLEIPSYDALKLGGVFCYAAWYRADEIVESTFPKLIFREWTDGGWGIECCKYPSEHKVNVVGGSTSQFVGGFQLRSSLLMKWKCLHVCYDGPSVSLYEDGVLMTTGVICASRDCGHPLFIGGNRLNNGQVCFNGQYDEIRLRGGTLSADRIKADYDMIANKNFCTYLVAKEESGNE